MAVVRIHVYPPKPMMLFWVAKLRKKFGDIVRRAVYDFCYTEGRQAFIATVPRVPRPGYVQPPGGYLDSLIVMEPRPWFFLFGPTAIDFRGRPYPYFVEFGTAERWQPTRWGMRYVGAVTPRYYVHIVAEKIRRRFPQWLRMNLERLRDVRP